MRLQKIRTYYPRYLADFYAERPELVDAPYAQQFRELMNGCFAAANFWAEALAPHGYEIFESVANAEPLQRRWVAENGAADGLDETNWLLEITARQVKRFAPTVLFVVDYTTFTPGFLRRLRADNPSIRLVLGWCGAAYQDASVFHEYDIVLSCVPELVDEFRRQGHRALHLNHAFAPQILDKIDATKPPTTDFSFVGSIIKGPGFHNERERLILELVEGTSLQIWTAMRHADPSIAARIRPALWGRAMYEKLRDSKISLNTHIDISPQSASNMRLYEATGVGSCLLTEWRENLRELFEPDVEVVTYRSVAECIEKVNYLLEHEEARQAIAEAGQRRTLREHTYTQWAAKGDAIIRNALAQSTA